ncbi:hypothetical protein ANTPLA_LOCUS8599 [Anthophora plagiata]
MLALLSAVKLCFELSKYPVYVQSDLENVIDRSNLVQELSRKKLRDSRQRTNKAPYTVRNSSELKVNPSVVCPRFYHGSLLLISKDGYRTMEPEVEIPATPFSSIFFSTPILIDDKKSPFFLHWLSSYTYNSFQRTTLPWDIDEYPRDIKVNREPSK